MRCAECGSQMKVVTASYCASTKMLGDVELEGIQQYSCNSRGCDSVVVSLDQFEEINKRLRSMEAAEIDKLPIGDFVTISELCEILGCSKQAVSKNKRITRGFIISKSIDGRRLYYRPSVLEYVASSRKDGRMLLVKRPLKKSELLENMVVAIVQVRSEYAEGFEWNHSEITKHLLSYGPFGKSGDIGKEQPDLAVQGFDAFWGGSFGLNSADDSKGFRESENKLDFENQYSW